MDVKFAQIEPTTRCNYTCGFCCGRAMRQGDLPLSRFEEVLATWPGLEHIELQGEGEPLMHPRFFDMVELARARGIKVSFTTNGSYFTPEHIARILDLGVEYLMISLESADADTFRAVRGGRFDKVESGVRALMAKRGGAARPVVGFAVTILKRTLDHLDGIIALYQSLGLDGGITFQLLQRRDAYTRVYDATLRADYLDAADLADLRRRLAGDERLARIQRERRRVGFFDELFAGWRQDACPWLSRGAFVNIDGHVTGCCTIKDATLHSLGTIGSSPASAFSDGRERLAASLVRGEIPDACAQCEIAERLVRPT